ncbi:hypothetical protein FM996_01360 [Methylosinus sporium]|uniref:Uncharacterized protein n=1 Tax=Methylosinus sporium TaxID=428 RepID=A0A549T7T6_METSR|nr:MULTISPECIES: hypothetical protein [Methylosinus]MBU3889023.1 hypothetical protein [Methylosinus sp. KRF6]TRL37944.1 hypothetical protein FM996_01360 [Methylosinus sporium]
MGVYIAHTRRKTKPNKPEISTIDAAAIAAREQALAALREQQRIEAERARAEKAARALRRAVGKRMNACDPDTSGRRRTAARAAGIMLISATGGVRTQSVTLFRGSGRAGSDLWLADVQFEQERGVAHFINDLATPADKDALHAMRALAPRIAEHIFIGAPPQDGVDDRNMNTAFRLARSFMHKTHYTASLSEEEKERLSLAIFEELQSVTAMRLRHLHKELERIVETLMHKTKLSRSECNGVLAPIYEGYEEFRRAEQEGRPQRAPRYLETPAERSPSVQMEEEDIPATGTHGR